MGDGAVGGYEGAVGCVGVGKAAEGEVGRAMVAGAAGIGELAVGFGGTLGAAVDVEEDLGVAGVDEALGQVELIEGAGLGGVAELPEEGDQCGVGGGWWDDEDVGVVVLVKDGKGSGGGEWAGWVWGEG